MNRVALLFIVVICLIPWATGISRRCYQCRSRGLLGDCRDPFKHNGTTAATAAISSVPCPSGWCAKYIEGISGPPDEYGTATERSCLVLAPSDEEERCAKVTWNNKPTLICFCRGDLCNSAQAVASTNLVKLVTISAFIYYYFYPSFHLPSIF